MNSLDIILLIVIFLLGMLGLVKGIIKTVFFLVSTIGGSLCGLIFYKPVAGLLGRYVQSDLIANILAYLGIFILVLVILNFIGSSLKKLLKKIKLGWLDRASGFALGALIGVFINSILIILLTLLAPQQSTTIDKSKLASTMLKISKKTIAVFPAELRNVFFNKVNYLDKK